MQTSLRNNYHQHQNSYYNYTLTNDFSSSRPDLAPQQPAQPELLLHHAIEPPTSIPEHLHQLQAAPSNPSGQQQHHQEPTIVIHDSNNNHTFARTTTICFEAGNQLHQHQHPHQQQEHLPAIVQALSVDEQREEIASYYHQHQQQQEQQQHYHLLECHNQALARETQENHQSYLENQAYHQASVYYGAAQEMAPNSTPASTTTTLAALGAEEFSQINRATIENETQSQNQMVLQQLNSSGGENFNLNNNYFIYNNQQTPSDNLEPVYGHQQQGAHLTGVEPRYFPDGQQQSAGFYEQAFNQHSNASGNIGQHPVLGLDEFNTKGLLENQQQYYIIGHSQEGALINPSVRNQHEKNPSRLTPDSIVNDSPSPSVNSSKHSSDEEEFSEEDEEEEDEDDEGSEESSATSNNNNHNRSTSLTRDERRAREANIPLSYQEIVNLSIDQFNDQLAKFKLSESQLTLIKDIRRRGKNKVAAQSCRKRKMEQIYELQHEVNLLIRKRNSLNFELNQLINEHKILCQHYDKIHRHIQETAMEKH